MKKLILMFVIAIVAVTFTQAQTVNMPIGATYAEYNLPVTVTNTVTSTTYFNAAVHQPATQDFRVKLAVAAAADTLTNVVVTLSGTKFGDTWTTIGSAVNWKLTTADTIITISNATLNRFRKYKVTYTGTGTGTVVVNPQKFKLYLE